MYSDREWAVIRSLLCYLDTPCLTIKEIMDKGFYKSPETTLVGVVKKRLIPNGILGQGWIYYTKKKRRRCFYVIQNVAVVEIRFLEKRSNNSREITLPFKIMLVRKSGF